MDVARQASLSFSISRSLLKLMSIESEKLSNNLILCRPLLLLSSIFASSRVFSSEFVLPIRWPMYYSFSFSTSLSNEYSGLISFRVDWFDLLEAQGTLKSLLQHHNSKASILQRSAFFMVQLSYPYMTTRKNVVLTIWIFVGKVMSLPFFFNWRIIALHNFVVFYQTSTWISHRYTYILSLLNLPPISCPIPPL